MKREQIEDVITFTNIFAKTYYDKFYIILKLTCDNITYLRLHYEYEILNLNNRKLHYQKIDSFQILEKMRSLAYRLKFFLIIKIHFIMSIAQLKSALNDDSYERSHNTNPFFIKEKIEKNIDFEFVFKYKFYKIERFLKRHNIEKNIIYLIK